MDTCRVVRTHRRGVLLPPQDWGTPIEGSIRMYFTLHPALRRTVKVFALDVPESRHAKGVVTVPDLLDPDMQTFMSDRGMSLTGFEEIDGQRFYQGWWVQWT